MAVTTDASDYRILLEFYKELSFMDKRKIWLAAYRKAAQPLLQKAKSTAPVDKGNLRKSLTIAAVPMEIAIDVGADNKKGWNAHFIEEGTKERFRKTKTGKVSTGKMIGTHFFENAVAEESEKITESAETEFYEAIDKAIIKYNKKSKK